jgi:hypothetical protein
VFIGHFGVSFAAKKAAPRVSLGTLFMAGQFIDLLWPLFLLLGLEQVEVDPGNTTFTPLNFISYPLTHSLAGVLVWALLFGGVYFAMRKDTRAALLLAGLVISHWLLDLLVHRPDLQLLPGLDLTVGLGMWNSVALTILVEGLIFAGGVWMYLRSTSAANSRGRWGLWGLLSILVIIYVMNLLGPPPPDAKAIGYVGLAQWLLVAWGYWVDGNRRHENEHACPP